MNNTIIRRKIPGPPSGPPPGFKKRPPGPPSGPPPSKMIAAFAASIAAKQLETPGPTPGLLSQKNQKEEEIRDNIQETQKIKQLPQPLSKPPVSEKIVKYIRENILKKEQDRKEEEPDVVINTKISEQKLSQKMEYFKKKKEENRLKIEENRKEENRLQEEEERLRKERDKLKEEEDILEEEEDKLEEEENRLREEIKLIQNKTSNSNQEKLNYIIDKEEIIDIKKSKYFTELKELQNKLSFKLSSKLLNKAELIITEIEENKQKLDKEYENIIKYNNIMNGNANIFNTQSYIINKNIQTINKDFINDIISNYSDAYKASLNNYKKFVKFENKQKQKLDYIFNL
jgi:hypothetical protein